MEDCLVAAQKGKLVLEPAHVDVLLQGVDLLVQIAQIDEPEIEEWQSEHAAAIDAFVAAISAVQEGKASPPARGITSPAHAITSETPAQLLLPATRKSLSVRPCLSLKKTPASTERAPGQPLSIDHPTAKQDRERSVAEATCSILVPDRVVRVTAESLTRLMGLAGEALVQTHRLPPLVQSLWRLKGRQTGLLESLQLLEDRLSNQRYYASSGRARAADQVKDPGPAGFAATGRDRGGNRRVRARQ